MPEIWETYRKIGGRFEKEGLRELCTHHYTKDLKILRAGNDRGKRPVCQHHPEKRRSEITQALQ